MGAQRILRYLHVFADAAVEAVLDADIGELHDASACHLTPKVSICPTRPYKANIRDQPLCYKAVPHLLLPVEASA